MAIKKVIEVEVNDNFAKATEHAKDFNKETTNTKENLKGVTDVADKATGGMASKFSNLTGVIGSVAKGFTTLKGAIIASGIGALALIIGGVISAFRSSEEGQNKFAKIMGVIGTVVGNLIDILSDLGEKVISVFENPKKAIQDFANLIKQNIVNRFNGLLELIPKLGKAINQLFKGDFSGASKTAIDAAGKVVTGMESVTDSINNATKATKEFIKEQQREAAIAIDIANKRAKADRIERGLLTERAKADRDIADLREKAIDRENFTTQQRIAFLLKAQQIEDSIAKKEIEAAKIRAEQKTRENELSKSTKEDLKEEQELKAKVIDLETRSLQASKTLTKSIQTLRREDSADAKAKSEEKRKLADDLAKAEKEANDLAYKEASDKLAKEIELQDKQYDLLQESTNSKFEQEIFLLTKQYDAKFELAIGNAELEKALEEKQKTEIAEIREKYRLEEENKNKEALEKKKVLNEKELEEAKKLEEAKFDTAKNTLGLISGVEELFANSSVSTQKKAFKVKKAADLASATLDGYRAVLSTYAQTPGGPVLKGIAAGVAGGFAALQISKISQSKFGGSESSFGGSDFSGSIPSPTESRAPQFNIVGQGGVGQAQFLEQKPMQAYVVSGEVTSQQALDRNRLRNATL